MTHPINREYLEKHLVEVGEDLWHVKGLEDEPDLTPMSTEGALYFLRMMEKQGVI